MDCFFTQNYDFEIYSCWCRWHIHCCSNFFSDENTLNFFVHEFLAEWGRISLGHTHLELKLLPCLWYTLPGKVSNMDVSIYTPTSSAQEWSVLKSLSMSVHVIWRLHLFLLWSQDHLLLQASASCMPFLSYTLKFTLTLDWHKSYSHQNRYGFGGNSLEDL